MTDSYPEDVRTVLAPRPLAVSVPCVLRSRCRAVSGSGPHVEVAGAAWRSNLQGGTWKGQQDRHIVLDWHVSCSHACRRRRGNVTPRVSQTTGEVAVSRNSSPFRRFVSTLSRTSFQWTPAGLYTQNRPSNLLNKRIAGVAIMRVTWRRLEELYHVAFSHIVSNVTVVCPLSAMFCFPWLCRMWHFAHAETSDYLGVTSYFATYWSGCITSPITAATKVFGMMGQHRN